MGPDDIANTLAFPDEIDRFWGLRGYYGTLYHNAKATYVKYLGWFDGNPANLHVLPPVAAARKYVEYMGGAKAVLKRAAADYAKGEYRWVAEVASRVVFADPANRPARELEADALEQLGYQAESGPWRNFYLSGAKELRDGVQKVIANRDGNQDMIRALPNEMFLDFLGVRLNAGKAAGKRLVLNLVFPDTKETFVLTLGNAVLTHRANSQQKGADATLTARTGVLAALAAGKVTPQQAMASGALVVKGSEAALPELLALLDTFDPWFDLVTPRAGASGSAPVAFYSQLTLAALRGGTKA